MEARELRIGNLVYNEVYEVSPIEGGDILAAVQCEAAKVPIEFLRPIKLTESWLIKFGFNREKNWQDSWLWDDEPVTHVQIGEPISGIITSNGLQSPEYEVKI